MEPFTIIFEITEFQKVRAIFNFYEKALKFIQENSKEKLDIWTVVIEDKKEISTFLSCPHNGLKI